MATEFISQGDDPIDYDTLIMLDAESLAEGGLLEGYQSIRASVVDECVQWLPMTQAAEGTPQYQIQVAGETRFVYGSPPKDNAWAMAGATLLDVVNEQLKDCPFKIYALMGGNDLSAVPLNDEQFREAHKFHTRPYDRPYIPTYEPPNYGFPQ